MDQNFYERDYIPIGTAVKNIVARIEPTNVDLPNQGELWISGTQVFDGYSDANLNYASFEERDGIRWYKTGDLVSRNKNAEFIFEGRIDRQVKVLGNRINMDAIEFSAKSAFPNAEFFGCVVTDSGTNILTLFTTKRVDSEELLAHLNNSLPKHLVPQKIVGVDTFPRNTNGNIDSEKLLQMRPKQ